MQFAVVRFRAGEKPFRFGEYTARYARILAWVSTPEGMHAVAHLGTGVCCDVPINDVNIRYDIPEEEINKLLGRTMPTKRRKIKKKVIKKLTRIIDNPRKAS